jgi:hypothetical protein
MKNKNWRIMMISSEQAANLFIESIIFNAYRGVYQIYDSMLKEGLPGRVDDPNEIEKWYQKLDEIGQTHIKEVVRAAIREAVFNVLVVLDNRTGGNPIRGQSSDFALYIQTYIDSEAKANNQSLKAVRFNSLFDDELHDLFISTLDEPLNI